MGNFKLIAIVPLKNCDKSFSKNLERENPYLFCKNHSIEFDSDGAISKVTKTVPDIPESIFELQNGIKLNFSAVVGKNGSGKSSIVDLLFYFIYAVYTKKKYKGQRILLTEEEEIIKRKEIVMDDYLYLESIIKEIENNPESKAHAYNAHLWKAVDLMRVHKLYLSPEDQKDPETIVKKVKAKLNDVVLLKLYAKQKSQYEEDAFLSKNLDVAIVFENDGIICEVSYRRGAFSYSHFEPDKILVNDSIDEFDPEDFFYTISVNYSHHSLNSRSVGSWINKLFHKNDGYITPVVINPMRDEGNFNINDELKLSKERLFANILYDMAQGNVTKILGKYEIEMFLLRPKINTSRFSKPFQKEFFDALQSKQLLQEYDITIPDDMPDYWDLALDYLESKIERIGERYLFAYYDPAKDDTKQEQLIKFLLEDKSHITKKVRQVLNFLKGTNTYSGQQYWKIVPHTLVKSISPRNLNLWLRQFEIDITAMTPPQLIEYGLPGLFSFDMLLRAPSGSEITFSRLSSGEQQLVFNSNAILYHLYNLDSVHSAKPEPDHTGGRIAYKNINIILDEVELYYHPEMQRRLVSELIASFERIRTPTMPGIEGINVIILTHSPFILSDIPDQHVLSLNTDKGYPIATVDITKTFGGNIHEILINNFFMDATIGEHSISTIEQLIKLYIFAQQADNYDSRKKLREEYSKLEDKYAFIIENVGEDVIREVLSNNQEYIKFVISM